MVFYIPMFDNNIRCFWAYNLSLYYTYYDVVLNYLKMNTPLPPELIPKYNTISM